jgi:rhodanese-related sulfurtransferase
MSEPVRISPAEAHSKMNEGYTYIDVRRPDEFAAGRPAGAVNVPLGDDFAARMSARYAKDAKLVLGCRAGIRSMQAARALLAAGFTNVLEMRTGWEATYGPFGEIKEPGWSRTGLPTEKG